MPAGPTPFDHIQCILAAVDTTPAGRHVWTYASGLARDRGARLQLLHVVDPVTPLLVPDGEPPDAAERHAIMEGVFADLRNSAPDLDVRTAIADGRTVDSILEAIGRYSADLVVVATHGRRGLEHEALPSIAETLVRLATCPVLSLRVPAAD